MAELATGGPYELLETAGRRDLRDDLRGPLSRSRMSRVRVAKPDAPMAHDVAEVAVTVERDLRAIGGPEAPV